MSDDSDSLEFPNAAFYKFVFKNIIKYRILQLD